MTGSEDDTLEDDDDVTPMAETELRSRVESMLERNPNMGVLLDDSSAIPSSIKKTQKANKKTPK